jgi:hypothetical protein
MGKKSVTIRFYEELNDFIPNRKEKREYPYWFYGFPKVKDAIESFGIPHTEVDLILANGQSVDFNYKLKDHDRIAVYPRFESFDVANVTKLNNAPLREIRFILDVHLGKLARYLRLTGFDTFYHNQLQDDEIIRIALDEHRIILTRDKGILKNRQVTHGYYIRSDDPRGQLKEVIRRFDLKDQVCSFERCMECNGYIKKVRRSQIDDKLPEDTRNYYQDFYQCTNCQQIYWKGSHYNNMKKFIEEILESLS